MRTVSLGVLMFALATPAWAATRKLTADELAKAKAQVGDSLVAEQSFATTLRPQGDVWFLAESLLPPASFQYRVWKDGKELTKFAPDPEISSWSGHEIDAVTFKDFDGDGDDDIGIVAQYMTGIGPEGAKPFAVAEIYTNDGKGFRHDAAFAKKLEKAKVTTMKALLKIK